MPAVIRFERISSGLRHVPSVKGCEKKETIMNMQASLKKWSLLGAFALLVALLLSLSPLAARGLYASSSAAHAPAVSAGHTTGWANVRTGPATSYPRVTVYAPNTPVTIYATVSGQVVWGGIATWDRISRLDSAPLYIYAGLIAANGAVSPPSAAGKVIVISLSRQWMNVYQDGVEVYNAAVMTGRPALPTPTGTYHVFARLSPTTFYSPWPYGSPYWYPPTTVSYALEWGAGGYFLHDSWWHSVYGPGTNDWHYDPVYGWQWGTHGCVAMPLGVAAWLYNWAPIGTTVQINP